jgi:predicted anti-sigma-YlaC factor YlaD
MNHLSEEQIVLHCYGDAEKPEEVRLHLSQCSACQSEFDRVRQLLQQIEPVEVPEPPVVFEEKTWLNLRDRLPRKSGFRQWLQAPPKWALAGTVATLILAAFLMGRFWPRGDIHNAQNPPTAANPQLVLVAVGDHLERSQMLLVEIMNTDATNPADLSGAEKQARDLLDANHLYRASAQRAGDPQIAKLLDELGRVLTEIANSPSDLSPADLQQIRSRIQSEGLLFKVRIVGSEVNSRVRRQEQSPAGSGSQRL